MAYETDGTSAIGGTEGQATIDGVRVARLTNWSMNRSSSESAWGDSDSEGWTFRKTARHDGTGSLGGKFDDDNPPHNLFDDGDIVSLILWLNTTKYYAAPSARIQNFQLEVNQDTKEVVGWTADWGTDGKVYKPGEAGAPAAVYPSS
jgi:hypothetical protein